MLRQRNIRDILRANEIYMPTYDIDMVGATSAIIRLQDTYNITAREVSDGVIKGLIPSPHQLTAEDCVNIAEIAHITRRYVRMKEWLDEGERLINDPTLSHRHGNTTTMLINEFLAWAYYLSNNISEALRYTELVLKEDPTKKEVLENKEVYSWYVSRNVPCTMPETTYMESAEKVMGIMQNSPYIKACKDRNPKRVKVKDESSLVSFYKQDKPRLILKPLRVSRLHDNPEVYMLYDVLKEKDMEKLRRIAIPRLKVAEVMDPENDSRIMANYRVSKSMFLQPFYPADHRISSRLNLRFEDITDLDMSASEELQLNNYGLGGQYEFHHDYGERGTEIEASPNGNRIATVLCYLSNVERGGETVFTEIGLSVLPKMGDALFWYNLHRNGTGVFNSKHASCPVLSGSKWVANKWVRMRGNEFSRKCSLNRFE